MKILDGIISRFDALILRSLCGSVLSSEKLSERETEFNKDAILLGNATNTAIKDAYGSIDVKATAILQHVSIMIAVAGILYSQAVPAFFKTLFGVETLLYVVLALFCLRLLMMQNHSSQYSDLRNVVAKQAILEIVAKLTFLISIFLVITILLELVLR